MPYELLLPVSQLLLSCMLFLVADSFFAVQALLGDVVSCTSLYCEESLEF